MTIINRTFGFIFVHAPKTAGTSVATSFRRFSRPGDIEISGTHYPPQSFNRNGRTIILRKHSAASQIALALGSEAFDRALKFSVVRNPFDRADSIFRFLKYSWRNWKASAAMDAFSSLDEFIRSDFFRGDGPDRMFLPQTHWLCGADGNIAVDRVARFERLDTDIASIAGELGLEMPPGPIPKHNPSRQEPRGKTGLSPEAVDIIRNRYAGDFDLFGYSRNALQPDKA